MSSDSSNGKEELTILRQYIHHIPRDEPHFDRRFRQIDFILSFAIEHYDKHGKGDGYFTPTWKVDRESIELVKKLKENHPEVRVVISIGGVGPEFPFNPAKKDRWIFNAVDSIKKIIRLYNDDRSYRNTIDGIDIHYDVINSSEDEFSFCIGEVIKQLKNDRNLSIHVVSIAPTKLVEPYYLKLYLDNKHNIDLVDYQFYNQKFSTKEEVVDLYKKLVIDYNPAKVLAGIGIPVDPILDKGIKYLVKHKLLPGIFLWNFLDSIDGPDTFSIEKYLHDL
ncbi:chitinase 1-like [Vicia villosa]|uniref:chitinase 1-like n=1 Tax=Vicia villosa TaxID=3911 RepID=UPI00273B70FA|nr:chitinase 1-like [Vicia villosa]